MNNIDRAVSIGQLALLGALGYGIYLIYGKFTDENGWGSTTQNGQKYSLANQLFLTANKTGQIYDSTGSIGETVADISQKISDGSGLTEYSKSLLDNPNFQLGVPGTPDRLHGGTFTTIGDDLDVEI